MNVCVCVCVCVCVGSLRDHKWYRHIFDDIRRRHPEYRVAILYVTASEEVCIKSIYWYTMVCVYMLIYNDTDI